MFTSGPAAPDDFAGIAELHARWETVWFGSVEQSADEVIEQLTRLDPLAENSIVLRDGARLVAAGVRWRADTSTVVHPDADLAAAYRELLPWFAAREPSHVDLLSRDNAARAVVEAAGWRHGKSAFELFRTVDDAPLPEPLWPADVAVAEFSAGDAAEVHELIYRRAGWTEIPGHPDRELAEWRELFMNDNVVPDLQVFARREDRLVGVALGRIWEDGTGWVSQLAVAKDERGRGLGRALLREALRRYAAAGATQLGLSVQADNRGALRMYLEAGLQIDREWMTYLPPR